MYRPQYYRTSMSHAPGMILCTVDPFCDGHNPNCKKAPGYKPPPPIKRDSHHCQDCGIHKDKHWMVNHYFV